MPTCRPSRAPSKATPERGKSFQEVKQALLSYLGSSRIREWLDEGGRQRLERAVRFALNQVEQWLLQDVPYWSCPDEAKRQILEALDVLIEAVIKREIGDSGFAFASDVLQLIFNFNKRANSRKIADKLDTLQRLLSCRESLLAAIEVLRALIKRAEALVHFSPPAFELSRHYLQTLEEHIKEHKKTHRERTEAIAKSLQQEPTSGHKEEGAEGKGGK